MSSAVTTAAHVHGYSRIDTPMFEDTDLFLRTVGAETDIAQKEMYSFEDRGGQPITLRPEGTAGCAGPTCNTDSTTRPSRSVSSTSAQCSVTTAPRRGATANFTSSE